MVKKSIRKYWLLLSSIFILGFIYSGMTVGIAIVLENAVNISIAQDMQRFIGLILFTVIYIIAITLVFSLYRTAINKLMCKVIPQIRSIIFESVLNKNHDEYGKNDVANYLSALTNDMTMMEDNYLTPLITVWQNCCLFFLTFLMLLRYSYLITIWLVFLLFIMFIFPNIVGRIMQKRQKNYSDDMGRFIERLKEYFSGYEVIRSFNVLDIFMKKFETVNEAVIKSRYKRDKLMVVNDSISSLLSSLLQISILFIGGYMVICKTLTIGALIALMQLCGLFTSPLTTILQSYTKIKSATPILDKLDSYVTVSTVSIAEHLSHIDTIIVSDLSFKYPNSECAILNNIDIILNNHEKYLIIGKSGCGKSTFVKLLAGYYDNYTGAILYNNRELKKISQNSLSDLVSIIHQNVFMFDISIRENITLFRKVSDDEMQRVCELSGIDLFINKLENGLDTIMGENGKSLSGGQKQRVAIARALIQKKEILILDEGTSSLDKETARDIEKRILSIAGIMVLTISHDFNKESIAEYDRIILIKDEEAAEIKKQDVKYV